MLVTFPVIMVPTVNSINESICSLRKCGVSVVHVVKNALAIGGQAQIIPGQTLDKVLIPLVLQVGPQGVILLFGLLDLGLQRLALAAKLRQTAAVYPDDATITSRAARRLRLTGFFLLLAMSADSLLCVIFWP